ncbi:unnamed protein product [Brachionus calyciflorus]|uniref:Rabenosyn-5 n=1 Tax=Brachionus calyciflorus TaxID=104777 RepID=A0A813SFT0_9BILA|nr:unnamed protein product [Brachionus calyciflorus]
MLASSMIIEGFICPECQQDLSNIELLQAHFELVHSNKNQNTQEKNDSKQIKNQTQNQNGTVSAKFMKQYFNSNQNDGYFKSHTDEFKKLRDNTIGRYVIQTNKLLITLDKLISFDFSLLNDDAKRDSHYKSIVPWVSDKDVQLCPNCAKGFNLITRKHHCRLCGAIMCNKCSKFISFTLAKLLTDPDSLLKAHSNKSEQIEFKLKRSDSITSMNSYFFRQNNSLNSSESPSKTTNPNLNFDQMYLRLCFNCGLILEKKYNIQKDKIIKPEFANLYDDLHLDMIESQRLYPVYVKMAESLNLGEAIYQLGNAEDIRDKLIKLFQKIELRSNLIIKYGVKDAAQDSKKVATISNDQFRLQKNIRFHAINYLRENSFTLPQIPSYEDYEKLKKQRERYLMEEIKRTEMEQRKKMEQKLSKMSISDKQNKPSVSIDNTNGWVPTFKPASLLDDDGKSNSYSDDVESNREQFGDENLKSEQEALRIQIQLVEAYLKDAQKHKKYEEAKILQENLNELLQNLANLT